MNPEGCSDRLSTVMGEESRGNRTDEAPLPSHLDEGRFDEPRLERPEETGQEEKTSRTAYEGHAREPEGGIEDLKIGAILQRAREERDLTLQDAEDATKIRKRYLKALESDDYTALPDPVYILGFLRTYGNYLGLDGDRLAEEVKRRRARRRESRQNNYKNLRRGRLERSTLTVQGVSGARRRLVTPQTLLTVIVSVVLIVLVIGLLYLVGAGGQTGSVGTVIAAHGSAGEIGSWAGLRLPV